MKSIGVIAIIIVVAIIGVTGYTQRHAIKSMLSGSTEPAMTQAPGQNTEMVSPTMASSSANEVVMTKTDKAKGDYLTDPNGMTLYIYDKDQKGISNCYNACAKAWPPYLEASPSAMTKSESTNSAMTMPENITTVKRTDGTMEYAWKGMPLYYYVTDLKAGDITGDGVGGVWHIIKP